MKNKKVLIALLIILSAIAVYLVWDSKNTSTIRPDLREFAIKDTASIGRFVISDKIPSKVEVSRLNGSWMVNNKYPVQQSAINTLIQTMYRMQVKQPVGEAMKPLINSNLATKARKVEIYDLNNKHIKTLYVGGPTQDHLGTFALIEGAESPFVVYMPGFDGYLTTRFFTAEDQWRDKTVLDIDNSQIAKVKMQREDGAGFTLEVEDLYNFKLLAGPYEEEMPPDTVAVQRYIGNFRKLSFEGLVADGDRINQDSLRASAPFFVMDVLDKSGNTYTIKGYRKANNKGSALPDGSRAPYDVDRFYGDIGNGKIAVLQYVQYSRVHKSLDDLLVKND